MPPTSSEKATLQASLDSRNSTQSISTPTPTPPTDLPPSYETSFPSNTTTPASTSRPQPIPSQNPLQALSRLSNLNFTNYNPPHTQAQAKLSDDRTTLTITNPELANTQYALTRFIHEQAALPPKPIMIIRGTHRVDTITDFELKVNLTSLLDLDIDIDNDSGIASPPAASTHPSRGASNLRVKPFPLSSSTSSSSSSSSTTSPTTLQSWLQTFLSDKSESKSLSLHRVIPDLPTSLLEGMVRTLLAQARYRGKVSVEFPIWYTEVCVVRSSGNWLGSLLGFYKVRRFDVLEGVWGVGGRGLDGGGGGAAGSGSGSGSGRAALVVQEWWKEWQGPILNAVLGKRKGWVTVEDWMEVKMGVREKERRVDWGVDDF